MSHAANAPPPHRLPAMNPDVQMEVEAEGTQAENGSFRSVGIDGNSGLSRCSKFRYSLAAVVMWVSVVVTSGMRNVYVVIFGGPATALSIVFIIIGLSLGPFMAFASYLFKTECATSVFPVHVWGRYGGFMGLVTIFLSPAILGIFIPPVFDDLGICLWVAAMYAIVTFAQAVIMIGMQAGEVEIFPFQKERNEMTLWTITTALLGCFVAITCTLAVTAYSAFVVRLVCGIICALLPLICMKLALEPYSRAQQPGSGLKSTFLEDVKAAFGIGAFRWIMFAVMFDGTSFAINVYWLLYFLIYNLNMYSDEAAIWFGAVLGATLLTNVTMSPVFEHFMNRPEPLVDIRILSVIATALKPVVWIGIMSWNEKGIGIVLAYVGTAVLSVSSTFYTSIARGWVIDEDTHRTGIRRESVFQGSLMCVQWTSITSLPVIMLLIVSLLGFDADDCSEFDSGSEQQHVCERQSDDSQPEVVEQFIYWAQLVPCTVFWWLAAYMYYRFPIHGERLQQLEVLQAKCFKQVVLESKAESALDVKGASKGHLDPDVSVKSKCEKASLPPGPIEDHDANDPQPAVVFSLT